jgi:hypothetical protein
MIPLDFPTYALDGWGGNFTDDAAVDWVVTSEEGWSSAPTSRTNVEDRPAEDGGYDAPSFDSARIITLSGTAIAPHRRGQNEAKDRFNGAAPSGPSLYVLTVQEEHLARRAYVRRSGDPKISDKGSTAFDWSLTLVAADPRKYAEDESSGAMAAPTLLVSGRTYGRVYPMYFGAIVNGASSVVVDNRGNYPTGAVVQIRGGLTRPTITNLRSGENLGFDLTLRADDVLTVDLLARTAVLNGSASRRRTITSGSSWWLHNPGLTPLRLSGTPTAQGTPSMTVTYRSAWK